MLSSTVVKTEKKQASSTQAGPWYSWVLLILRILLWQVAAIFLVELCLSIAGLGEEEILKLDPVVGFKHMCNKKVTWRSEGLATFYFDADGMREPGLTVAKPAGVYRVALLGDSLTESLQVPWDESFGAKIQNSVSRQTGRPVQVLNFACSGYSTVQEYLQLKQQVMKYKPDLVLLCYNNRDCFENWSPPDEVITNVRPAALHLPGRQLFIDCSPVTQWMKTPRARFLKQVDFLRQKSRLWGLYAAAELDWSLHNETYKRLLLFFTSPGKVIRKTMSEWGTCCTETLRKYKLGTCKSNALDSAPSTAENAVLSSAGINAAKKVSTGTTSAGPAPTAPKSTESKSTEPASSSSGSTPTVTKSTEAASRETTDTNAASTKIAASNVSGEKQGTEASNNTSDAALAQQPGRTIYHQLIVRTLGSLFAEMDNLCKSSDAKFVVIAVPVRAALSTQKGMQTDFDGFSYEDEIKMLQNICKEKKIDLINMHERAKPLPKHDIESFFFLMHMTPQGQVFMANELTPFVRKYVEQGSKK